MQLDRLLPKYNLSQQRLSKPCDNNLFVVLTKGIISFDHVVPYFGLTPPDIDEIRSENPTEVLKSYRMLWAWKRKNGSDATYLAIVNIFLEMEDRFLAESVLQHVSDCDVCSCNMDSLDYCELESITSSQSCESTSTYKNWDEMTEDDKKHTLISLYEKHERVRVKYDILTADILESFEKNKVNFNNLKDLSMSTVLILLQGRSLLIYHLCLIALPVLLLYL